MKEFKLYINDGDDMNEPTTLVPTYTTNSLTHTLDLNVGDTYLVSGKIYKFKF